VAQRDRRARGGGAQGTQRRGAGDAVGGQTGPGLHALQRADRARAHDGVHRTGGEAVGGERELQGRHVPADVAALDRAAADRMAPAPAERRAGARARDPVGGQPGRSLQCAHGGGGAGSADPVDM